jgi:hypothetical protein
MSDTENREASEKPRYRGLKPYVKGHSGNPGGRPKGFASYIRAQTNDGVELVEFVLGIFRSEGKATLDLRLAAATWLADRGFGIPVQVGQLLDGEGNPVTFTLWSPASPEPIGDVITLKDGKAVDPETPLAYDVPAKELEPPKVKDLEPRDGYAHGPARAWGIGDVRE